MATIDESNPSLSVENRALYPGAIAHPCGDFGAGVSPNVSDSSSEPSE
jgi:hypothetical protein